MTVLSAITCGAAEVEVAVGGSRVAVAVGSIGIDVAVGAGVSSGIGVAVGSAATTKGVAVGTGVKVGCSVGVAGGSVLDVITKYWVNSRVKIKKSATDRIMIRPIRTIFRTVFSPKALVRFS